MAAASQRISSTLIHGRNRVIRYQFFRYVFESWHSGTTARNRHTTMGSIDDHGDHEFWIARRKEP